MGNRIPARGPCYDGRSALRRLEKMNCCEDRGDGKDRYVLATCPKQNAQNDAAKEDLFYERNSG